MVGSSLIPIKIPWSKSTGAVSLCALALFLWGNAWGYSPQLRWSTLQTRHFSIHHNPEHATEATKVAALAEETLPRIAAVFGWNPRGRVHITLVDEYDVANGSATPFPYNAITLYLPSPDPTGQLGEVNDWLRLVLTHELVHIVHLDMAKGGPGVLRKLMGKNPLGLFPLFPSTMPNLSSPLWITEGYGTLYESRLTGSGRLNGSFFDMMLRCDMLENDFLTLPQMTSWQTSWPGGTIRYLYGSSFLDFVTTRLGAESTERINDVQSRQIFPAWRVNAGLIPYGRNYQDFYFQWKRTLKDKYQNQARDLLKEPLTPTTALTDVGYGVSHPRISPSGDRVVYLEESPHRSSGMRCLDRRTGEDQLLVEGVIEGPVDWSPDGERVVFSELRFLGAHQIRKDLFIYDFQKKRKHRLTRGERSRDPAWHPTSDSIVYVRLKEGGEDLYLLDLKTQKKHRLVSGQEGERWSAPQWSPRGDRLAVSRAAPGETFDIVVFSTHDWSMGVWVSNPHLDLSPAWSPEGRGLYFVSDRTGVFNVYYQEGPQGEARRITNTLGGLFFPSPSSNGKELVAVQYTHRGFDLVSLPLGGPTYSSFTAESPVVSTGVSVSTAIGDPLASKSYSSLGTLMPRFWSPDFQGGVFTAGVDALGENAYSAFTFVGADHAVNWSNQSFYPFIFVDRWDFRRTVPLQGRGTSVQMEIPWPGFLSSLSLVLGVEKRDLDLARLMREDHRAPFDAVAHQEGWRAEVYYSNARQYGFSVYPERGRSLVLSSFQPTSFFGNSEPFHTYWSSWEEHWPGWGRHHSFSLGWMGGTSDRAAFDSFREPVFWNRAASLSRKLMDQQGKPKWVSEERFSSLRSDFVPSIDKDDRGFAEGFSQAHVSYRFPLGYPEDGPGMGFLFLDRLYGHLFVLSDRYTRTPVEPKTRVFVGAEVAGWWGMGYIIPLTVGLSVQKQTTSGDPAAVRLRVEFEFR